MVPAEEKPFSSDGQWADTVLDVVVVYLVPAVVDIPRQLADVAEQIVDGLADGTLGQHAAGLVERPSLQCPDDGVRQFPSQAGTLPIIKMPTVGQGLYAVEHADLVKGVLGTLLVMVQTALKIAATVRPTAQDRHPVKLVEDVIRRIPVDLQRALEIPERTGARPSGPVTPHGSGRVRVAL